MIDKIPNRSLKRYKVAQLQLHDALETLQKISELIRPFAPGFRNWLPGGDSTEGFNPCMAVARHHTDVIFERFYSDKQYRTITAYMRNDGSLFFEREDGSPAK